MGSFQITVSPSRRAAARLITDVRRQLNAVLASRDDLSQSEVGRRIGVHRSVINRELRGASDLTLGRLGELAWALGKKAVVSFEDPDPRVGNSPPTNPFIVTASVASVPTSQQGTDSDKVAA